MSDYCFHCIPVELICVESSHLNLSGPHKHMSCCKFCSIINCDEKNICKNLNIPFILALDNHVNLIRASHITINDLGFFYVFTILLCGSFNPLINKILRNRCTCKSENLMKSMFWPRPPSPSVTDGWGGGDICGHCKSEFLTLQRLVLPWTG